MKGHKLPFNVPTVKPPGFQKVASLDRVIMKNTQSSVGKGPAIPNKSGGPTFKDPPGGK